MNIIDFNFYLFLIVILLIYYSIPKNFQYIWLSIASIIYYFLLERRPLIVLLTSIAITYISSQVMKSLSRKRIKYLDENKKEMSREEIKEYKRKIKSQRKIVCTVAIVINIGLLCFFKYIGFAVDEIYGRFGITLSIPHFISPIGISYYIFKSSGYVLDVYRETYESETNFLKYSLFVSFFPTVFMGPIGRFKEERDQLFSTHQFDYHTFMMGIQRIIWGFFKKAVIADRLSGYVTSIFANYTQYEGSQLFATVLLFAIQEYADFSGCMDIVLGVAKLFGISITENFKAPFRSTTIGEFWRRWHITMGAWFRDYVFYEVICSKFCKNIAKSKKINKFWKQAIPVVVGNAIIWILIGFWHGASWHHVFWGIYNGILIIIGFLLKDYFGKINSVLHIPIDTALFRTFQRIRTFLLFSIGELFFVSNTMTESWKIVCSMFKQVSIIQFVQNISNYVCQFKLDAITAIIGVVILFVVDYMQDKNISIGERILQQNIAIRWGIYWVALFSIILLGIYGLDNASAFIYMGI